LLRSHEEHYKERNRPITSHARAHRKPRTKDMDRFFRAERKVTLGNWQGKFVPKEKHLLQKMFDSHKNSKSNRKKMPVPLHNLMAKKVDTKRPMTVNNTTQKSSKEEYIDGITLIQIIKKKQKQKNSLELSKQTNCYSKNPYSFIQKRYKMNPRFTWLCKTEENRLDWMQAINTGIDKVNNSKTFTRKSKIKSCYFYKNYKGYPKTSFYSECNEQRIKRLNSLNFSEVAIDKDEPVKQKEMHIESAQDVKIHKAEERERLIRSKNKGFSYVKVTPRDSQPRFPFQEYVEDDNYKIPNAAIGRTMSQKGQSKKSNNIMDPSENSARDSKKYTKGITLQELTLQQINKPNKHLQPYDPQILKERILVKQKNVHKRSKHKHDNIFNLGIAAHTKLTYA